MDNNCYYCNSKLNHLLYTDHVLAECNNPECRGRFQEYWHDRGNILELPRWVMDHETEALYDMKFLKSIGVTYV